MSTEQPTLENWQTQEPRNKYGFVGARYGKGRTTPEASTSHVPRCRNCGTEISQHTQSDHRAREIARVFGDSQNVVPGCLNCVRERHGEVPKSIVYAIKLALQSDGGRIKEEHR